mmetsp:Transcript_3718/g.10243  ORF Transcript_3718/g.10243 Transcript_3718/m.10243 type:complete len:445 (+) Transcript_3718:306-1640(+)
MPRGFAGTAGGGTTGVCGGVKTSVCFGVGGVRFRDEAGDCTAEACSHGKSNGAGGATDACGSVADHSETSEFCPSSRTSSLSPSSRRTRVFRICFLSAAWGCADVCGFAGGIEAGGCAGTAGSCVGRAGGCVGACMASTTGSACRYNGVNPVRVDESPESPVSAAPEGLAGALASGFEGVDSGGCLGEPEPASDGGGRFGGGCGGGTRARPIACFSWSRNWPQRANQSELFTFVSLVLDHCNVLACSSFACSTSFSASSASSQTLRTRSTICLQPGVLSWTSARPWWAFCAWLTTLRQLPSASSSGTDWAPRTFASRRSVSSAGPPPGLSSASACATNSRTEGPRASGSSVSRSPRSSSSFSNDSGSTTPCALALVVPRFRRLPTARLVQRHFRRSSEPRSAWQQLMTRSLERRKSPISRAGPTSRAPQASLAVQNGTWPKTQR